MILSLIEQIAQQTADPLEHPTWRARILLGGPQDRFLGKPGCDVAAPGTGGPPRWRRHVAPAGPFRFDGRPVRPRPAVFRPRHFAVAAVQCETQTGRRDEREGG